MHSHWSNNHQRDWQWNRNLDHALKIPSKKFSRNTSLQTQMHKFTKQKNTTRKSHLKIKITVNDKGNKRRQEKYLEKKNKEWRKKTYKQQNSQRGMKRWEWKEMQIVSKKESRKKRDFFGYALQRKRKDHLKRAYTCYLLMETNKIVLLSHH